MASLFENLPVSSEQVLHFDKYVENDLPADTDLASIDELLPDDWRPLYSNTLGEFEVRILFASHAETRDAAAELAAGWDGCRVAAYQTTTSPGVVVVGLSEWDTDRDAVEFHEAFDSVLRKIHDQGDYEIRRRGRRVAFTTGVPMGDDREAMLDFLGGLGE
jgi:hypothetical protein